MKFVKKPVVIDAMQVPAAHHALGQEFIEFMDKCPLMWSEGRSGGTINVHTLEGVREAQPGDWVIRDVAGEYSPCKPDIFEKTYSPYTEDGPTVADDVRNLAERLGQNWPLPDDEAVSVEFRVAGNDGSLNDSDPFVMMHFFVKMA